MRFFSLFLGPLLLVSCAGYQLGGSKPNALKNVRTIAVPMFLNHSLHPRAEALVTSAVANAVVQDGTYRIADRGQADAILEGTLESIEYSSIRGSRLDNLQSLELANRVTLNWKVIDAKNPLKLLASGKSIGTSQLFVSSNLQTAKNNALPEAAERAGEALVSILSNDY